MTLVIAHRGGSWDLPENTLPAFERAVEMGAGYVELDEHAARMSELPAPGMDGIFSDRPDPLRAALSSPRG